MKATIKVRDEQTDAIKGSLCLEGEGDSENELLNLISSAKVILHPSASGFCFETNTRDVELSILKVNGAGVV